MRGYPVKPNRITRRQFARDAAAAAVGIGIGLNAQAADRKSADQKPAAEKAGSLKITVLGDSSCIPDVGREVACYLINGKHLMDTGWCAALRMRQHGFDPLKLESILITHLHQDHYIGVPQLLFFAGLRNRQGPPLKIVGPSENLKLVVDAALAFLQTSRFPEIIPKYELVPLKAGDKVELSDVRVETFAAKHTSGKNRVEQAFVYKITDKRSGAWAVFSGDTSYHPPIAEFAKGTPLLIHDAAHTSAKDAADIAKRAGAGRLILTHYLQPSAARLLDHARAVFANTGLAKEGETLEVPPTR